MTWLSIFTAVLAAGIVGEALLRIERAVKARAERRRFERAKAELVKAWREAFGEARREVN